MLRNGLTGLERLESEYDRVTESSYKVSKGVSVLSRAS